MTLSDPGATILLMTILLKKGVSFQYATVSFNIYITYFTLFIIFCNELLTNLDINISNFKKLCQINDKVVE